MRHAAALRVEKYLEFQRRYYEIKESHYLIPLEKAPRRSISLPRPTENLRFFLFSRMLATFVESLAKEIDRFSECIHRVCALHVAYEDCKEEDKRAVYAECVHPIPEYALAAPRALRQRFLHAAGKLLLETGLAGALPPLPPLADERDLCLDWLKSCGGVTASLPSFVESLERLDDEELHGKISSFSSSSGHRVPLNIEHGEASVVLRFDKSLGADRHIRQERWMTIESQDAYCSVAALQPLKLADAPPLLADQHKMAISVFYAFEKVVEELLEAWRAAYNETLEYLVEA